MVSDRSSKYLNPLKSEGGLDSPCAPSAKEGAEKFEGNELANAHAVIGDMQRAIQVHIEERDKLARQCDRLTVERDAALSRAEDAEDRVRRLYNTRGAT